MKYFSRRSFLSGLGRPAMVVFMYTLATKPIRGDSDTSSLGEEGRAKSLYNFYWKKSLVFARNRLSPTFTGLDLGRVVSKSP